MTDKEEETALLLRVGRQMFGDRFNPDAQTMRLVRRTFREFQIKTGVRL